MDKDPNAGKDGDDRMGVFAIIGGVVLGAALLVGVGAAAFVYKKRIERKRRFRMMETFEDEFDESDSQNSLDVPEMHLRAAEVAKDASYTVLPRNGKL